MQTMTPNIYYRRAFRKLVCGCCFSHASRRKAIRSAPVQRGLYAGNAASDRGLRGVAEVALGNGTVAQAREHRRSQTPPAERVA